ncbi:hypothetical protein KDN24_24930 [Bacillus sp. Bva_UNVM-123]|uniref:DUF6773 family protein n=1 Tax=Bacillus sp. Bva_UNVM-123 TaxID=2829798 RepID=UPI00391F6D37
MGLFRKRKKVADERITHIQNKIYREIYHIVSAISLLSIITKFYLYEINIKLVITELIIIFISSIYYFVRAANLGIFSDEIEIHDRQSTTPMSSKNIYIGIGLGVAVGLFFGVRSAIIYGDGYANSMFTFAIVFLASIMIYLPFFLVVICVPYLAAKKASLKAAERDLDVES